MSPLLVCNGEESSCLYGQMRTMEACALTLMNAVASVPVVPVGPEEAPRNVQPRQRHCPATSAGASAQ